MLIGKTLRSRYKIIKKLGSGGFGDTYLAIDSDLPSHPHCVVKHLRAQNFNCAVFPIAKNLFEREAEFLYRLGSHDRIPRLYAHFEEEGEFYLVQEFIEGVDLTHEILPGKPWSQEQTVKLLQEILEVLAFVHQHNVIHRDIKPPNIIRRSRDRKLVLIDFGAVKSLRALSVDAQGKTNLTVAIGSPGYMPSEQYHGRPKLASDIYAVGMLGLQALTGVNPNQLQEEPTTGEIIWRDCARHVSAAFANVLNTMVRYHFRERYQNAKEALAALNSTVISLPQVATSSPATTVAEPIIISRSTIPKIEQVCSRSCDKIQNLYSKIQLLNLQQIDVERLYVDVYVLETPSYIYPATIPELLKVSDIRENFARLGLGRRGKRSPGLEAAKQHPRLMILGKPGSGKSTFLKHIAVACCKGEFLVGYIPIFIELREIDVSNFNLFNKIHQEFELDNEKETKKVLKNGEVLILLDGLDELASQFRKTVQKNIREFSEQYYKNYLIITCRTQTTEYTLPNFNYVEIADFNSEQVDCFANNWFSTINEIPEVKTKLKTQFIEKLKSPENKQIAELAITPILLSLTCWIFSEFKKFPPKRSDLYQQGINLLLSEWDEKKWDEVIIRDSGSEVYRKMSVEDRQKLLSHIAARKFKKQQYALFEENEIQKYIAEYLKISTQEAKTIPKTIELQHGLLVERAKGIYSFSHLTFQEFLTAQHISDQPLLVEQLVKNHLTDSRWREVFLLLAELKADDLLLIMEQQIQTYVTTPKLQSLLAWAEQITDTSETEIKPVGKRAIALANALAKAYAKAFPLANAKAKASPLAKAYAKAFAFIKANAKGYAKVKAHPKGYAKVKAFAKAFAYTNASAYTKARATKALQDFILYVKEIKKFTVYKSIDLNELVDKLTKLKEQIPEKNQPIKIYVDFAHKIIQTVLNAVQLTTEMIDLSREEIEAFDNYFDANKFMIDCKEAASQFSQDTWDKIEARMLLPKTTWKKLKQQS
ncbi:MAG: NACHT domain-containing protein [Prochloraceae cyanobacterium]|nr:NACHT domain-containing protein [Prochloraceae cyanobacterium]